MKRAVRVGVLMAVMIAAMARGPRQAHGQEGIAGALYSDLRDVIGELIRSEITTEVVRVVRERSPALGFYFRRTLERLESSYWGNLSGKLRADLVTMVSDYVYWSVRVSGEEGGQKGLRRMQRFLACFSEPAGDGACDPMKPLLAGRGRSLVDRHCRAADVATSAEAQLACDLALATRAGLDRQASMALRHVIDAVTDILLHDLGRGATKRRLRDVAQRWLSDLDAFPAVFTDLFFAAELVPDDLSPDWVSKHCKDTANLTAFFADPASSLAWTCFAVSYNGLPNALAFRIRIEQPGGAAIAQLLTYWDVAALLAAVEENAEDDKRPKEQRLYSMFVDAAVTEYCARNTDLRPPSQRGPALLDVASNAVGKPVPVECDNKALAHGHPVGATITVDWLDIEFTAKALPKRFDAERPVALARAMKSFRLAMERVDAMRQTVPAELRDRLFVEDRNELAPAVETLRAFLRIGKLVGELRARWYLWPDQAELSGDERLRQLNLGGLLGLALEVTGPSIARAGATASALSRIAVLLEGRQGLALRRVLDLAFRADVRELAVEGLRLALDLGKTSPGRRPFATFFLSMSGYLLDDSGDDAVEVTRESFRAAAKDLLRTLPSKGVPSADERWRLRPLPLVGVRLAFNNQYMDQSGADGRRYLVSADWPVAYLALSDFTGVRLSAFDVLAPLSELALREVGDWDQQRLLLWDFVRPRVGIWLAAPQISRRLILDAGVGLRMLGTREVEAGDDPEAVGVYRRKASAVIHLGLSYAL